MAALSRPRHQSNGARPRDGRTLLAAPRPATSTDGVSFDRSRPHLEGSRTATGVRQSARRRKRPHGRSHVLAHAGHRDEPGVWYAGTSPQGLFRSNDGGVTWEPFSSINDDPQYRKWMGTVQDGTPMVRSCTRSSSIRAIRLTSVSRCRAAACTIGRRRQNLDTILQGLEVVEGFDRKTTRPFTTRIALHCPSNPDRLYQQNHCGIYRLDRPSTPGCASAKHAEENRRHRLSTRGAPARRQHRVGVPMDGTTVWRRTSPAASPRCMRRATPARRGSASTPACLKSRRGGP